MKAAIIGYGKMGHAVERFLQERGHEIVARIDADNQEELKGEAFASADVAIEFSQPSQAVSNYRAAFKAGVPVVSGTTGWTVAMPRISARRFSCATIAGGPSSHPRNTAGPGSFG